MTDDSNRPENGDRKPPIPNFRPPGGITPPEEPSSEPEPVETKQDAPTELGASPGPARVNTPFHQHSLRGQGDRLKASAIDTKPLLGYFVMHGQATMIYAQANCGKTLSSLGLILEAIDLGRVDPNDVIYVNADDSSKGLAEKVGLLEAVGAHMLAPGHKGFKANHFADKLRESAQNGSARGRVVVIDTLKKFTNLMDKGRSSDFAQICREFIMAGGTIIALGHVAKSPNPDGTPRYQGTTDFLEDFDAVYVAEPMNATPGANERIIRFTQLKARAESPEVVAYAYSTEEGRAYVDKVVSLRLVYPEELDSHTLELDQLNEEQVVKVLYGYLVQGLGELGQDKIVRLVAQDGDISRAQARRVLDRYTGADPQKHRWNFDKGDRGKRTYYVLKSNKPSSG